MAASVRFYVYSAPIGFTPGAGDTAAVRLLQSGKLTSTGPTAPSDIVTIPNAPAGSGLMLLVESVYGDATARNGHGYAFLSISDPGKAPVLVQPEKTVEDAPRFLVSPPFAAYNAPGSEWRIAVDPGQRFGIIDAGFAV